MAFDKNRAICWRDPLQSLKRTIAMSAAYDEVDESPAKQPRAFEFHIYVDDSQDQTRAFEVNESQHAFEESQVVPKFSDVMEELERDHIDDIAPEEEALFLARPLQAVNFADVLQDLDREPDETLEDIDAVIQEEPFDLCEEARDDGPEIHGEGEDSYYMEGEGEDSDVEDEDAKIALQQLHIHASLHMIMENVERDDAVTLEAKLHMLEHMIDIIDNIEDSDEDVAPPGMEEKEDVVSPGMEEKDQDVVPPGMEEKEDDVVPPGMEDQETPPAKRTRWADLEEFVKEIEQSLVATTCDAVSPMLQQLMVAFKKKAWNLLDEPVQDEKREAPVNFAENMHAAFIIRLLDGTF